MPGTAIILLNENNEVLLGKRLKTKGFNKYAAPGGTIEKGEQDDEACVRECKEETRLIATDLIPLPTTNEGKDQETRWFFTTHFSGELENVEPEKCEDWLWFSLDDLPEPLWNGVGEILEKIKQNIAYEENCV